MTPAKGLATCHKSVARPFARNARPVYGRAFLSFVRVGPMDWTLPSIARSQSGRRPSHNPAGASGRCCNRGRGRPKGYREQALDLSNIQPSPNRLGNAGTAWWPGSKNNRAAKRGFSRPKIRQVCRWIRKTTRQNLSSTPRDKLQFMGSGLIFPESRELALQAGGPIYSRIRRCLRPSRRRSCPRRRRRSPRPSRPRW